MDTLTTYQNKLQDRCDQLNLWDAGILLKSYISVANMQECVVIDQLLHARDWQVMQDLWKKLAILFHQRIDRIWVSLRTLQKQWHKLKDNYIRYQDSQEADLILSHLP